MTNRLPAYCLAASAVLGAAFGAMVAGAGATATTAKPYWSYHNGNTLMGKSRAYRDGYIIGVIDGYLQAHERRARTGEAGDWLDRCIAGGWTAPRTTKAMHAHLDDSVLRFLEPIATVILDGMKQACAR